MRFLVDNQLPGALARWLITQGHSAEHVLDVNLAQAKDNPIWVYAQNAGAVIVSKDEDFADWVRQGRAGPAVLWLRLGNSTRRELLAWIEARLPAALRQLQEGERLVEVR